MKPKIHPKYYDNATITCACGNVFKVGSTVEKIEIEICSACHPFYTGKKKLIDSAGQVDRFQKKMEMAKKMQAEKKAKEKAKKSNKQSAKKLTSSKTTTSSKKAKKQNKK